MARTSPTSRRIRTRRLLRMQVLDDRRVLAAITGAVFDDANDSLSRNTGEAALVGRLVYVDQNDNSMIDAGEAYSLTDASGNFAIDGLADGEHSIRVFNGTSSQFQTTPNIAVFDHDAVAQTDITLVSPSVTHDAGLPTERVSPAIFLVGDTLKTLAEDGTVESSLKLGGDLIAVNRVTDGNLLVFTSTQSGQRVFTVSDSLTSVAPLTGSDSLSEVLSAGVDDTGSGVLVAAGSGANGELWSVNAGSLTATSVSVAVDTVITSDDSFRSLERPTRSILSHVTQTDDGSGGTTDGLAINVWSNQGESMITIDPIIVSGGLEVVAFSDEAGLLVIRGQDDLTVYDIDNHLAMLYAIPDTGAGVDIDAVRGLIVTTTPRSTAAEDAGVRILNQETGAVLVSLAIDLSAIGDIATIALDAKLESVVIAGAAGIAQVNLRRPGAHRITISNGADVGGLEFGLRVTGENTAPSYATPRVIEAIEDAVLVRPGPLLLMGASDPDGDQFIIIPNGSPAVGDASVSIDGGITFVPPPNFEGTVEVPVMLTDGRDVIETVFAVAVVGVPDAPTGINPLAPVPENIPLNGVLGVLDVIDVDLVNDHLIEVNDDRFVVINGELIFVGPGKLDFETEWSIPLIFTVTDPDTESTSEYSATISVTDSDDPVTDIVPGTADVFENKPGDSIKTLFPVDEDLDQFYDFSVDDARFTVMDGDLKLADGVSLDREAEATVTINVTVTHRSDSFTKAIVLTVIDAPETPADFQLDNATVLENKAGAIVGDLTIAGNPAVNGHDLTVNDSRFVFEDSVLRLADGVSVQRSSGSSTEIQIEVTATPTLGGGAASQTFIITVVENQLPFHNSDYPEDVNGNGEASALDALIIINYLNDFGPGEVGEGDPAFGYDVNADGSVSALDALLVINELNANGGGTGAVNNEPIVDRVAEGSPEGESIAEDIAADGGPSNGGPSNGDQSRPVVVQNSVVDRRVTRSVGRSDESQRSSMDPNANKWVARSVQGSDSAIAQVVIDTAEPVEAESTDAAFSEQDWDLLG